MMNPLKLKMIRQLFQANVPSLFWTEYTNSSFFFSFVSFDIFGLIKFIFENWKEKNKEVKIANYVEEKTSEELRVSSVLVRASTGH